VRPEVRPEVRLEARRLKLILFDIDGTLVDCGGQPKPLFGEALEEVYGARGDLPDYDFSGKTDPRIVVDLMTAAGVPAPVIRERLPDLRDAYLGRLERRLEPEHVRILPGVVELLTTLAERDDLVLGLLTGNWERGAGIKLGSVGLRRFFAFGSFGDGQTDRRDLPPVALARAAEHCGRAFRPEDTWIVGDSLLDVDCARAHGIACLAVATGRTEFAALAAAGAERVISDLTPVDEVIAALLA
jgi:phosphoglycolate phosphatase-like HAD superfamily hydrolase